MSVFELLLSSIHTVELCNAIVAHTFIRSCISSSFLLVCARIIRGSTIVVPIWYFYCKAHSQLKKFSNLVSTFASMDYMHSLVLSWRLSIVTHHSGFQCLGTLNHFWVIEAQTFCESLYIVGYLPWMCKIKRSTVKCIVCGFGCQALIHHGISKGLRQVECLPNSYSSLKALAVNTRQSFLRWLILWSVLTGNGDFLVQGEYFWEYL